MLSIFSYVSGPSVCPPWRSVCSSLLPIFNWVVCLSGMESCEFFMYFGNQTLVWGIIGKYVFPYCWFSFCFNAVFFSHAEAFLFDEVPLVYSFLYVPCFRGISVKILLRGMSEILGPMFSSRTFMVLQLIFKAFIHLEFIFVYGVSCWSSLIIFHVAVQLSQHHLLKSYFYSILCFFPLCQILIDHRDLGLFLGTLFCSIGLCVCSYASMKLFWLWWPCNTVWYQVLWSLLLCCSFSKLLQLLGVIYGSIWISEMLVLYLWNVIGTLTSIALNL